MGTEVPFRLRIAKTRAVAEYKAAPDAPWREIRVGGGFQTVAIHDSWLVIASATDQGWVELWSLPVTLLPHDGLLVALTMLAGPDIAGGHRKTAFSLHARGLLERIDDDP